MLALPNSPQMVPIATFQKVQQELQRANQKVRQLEQENQQLKSEKWQERNLRKKKDFKPAEKYTILELQRQIESPNTRKDDEGFTRFCYSTAAINTGLSDSTPKRKIEAILEQWPDCPIETKEVEEYEDGKKTPRLYIKPKDNTNIIQAAIDATLAEEHIRKQGGNKYVCQRCGSVNVKIIRRLHCDCCGHETDLEDTYPNGKLKNSTRRSNLLSEDDITDDSQEECDTGKTGRSNLLFEDVEPTDTFFDESLQVDDVTQESEHRQVESEADDDSNNKAPHGFADPDSIIEEWLGKRRGTSGYLYSTGSLEHSKKYKWKLALDECGACIPDEKGGWKHDENPNIAAFIAGSSDHIYGTKLIKDGKTSVLCFEIDQAEQNAQAENYLLDLSRAGAAAVYWQRYAQDRKRGHLELYFDRPVNPEVARQWALEICPELEEIPECYPCKAIEDKRNNALSWPMYQRIGGTVYPCKAKFMLPAPHAGGLQEVDPTDKEALAQLVTDAVTPAALIEEFTVVLDEREKLQSREQERENAGRLVIGHKPRVITNVSYDHDLAKQVIADVCAQYSWDDLADMAGGMKSGFFKAVWRGEKTASVKPDKDGQYACDYGNHGSFPKKLDKYEAYCLIQGIDKRTDLAERCAQLRRLQIKIVEPTTELFPTERVEQKQQSPVYAICPVCSTPKSVKRADGVYTCGTDHVG